MSQPKITSDQLDIDLSPYATNSSVTNLFSTAAGRVDNIQYFTSSGTFTVPTGITKVKVYIVGGGGGGGTISGGGGGATEGVFTVTPGQVITVTVGAGGVGTGSGGTTSFGAFCTATGGATNQVNGVATGGTLLMNNPVAFANNVAGGGPYGSNFGYGGPFGGNGKSGLCIVQW